MLFLREKFVNLKGDVWCTKCFASYCDRHMASMIMSTFGNRSFTLPQATTNRHATTPHEWHPTEYVLPHLLFIIYTSDLSTTVSRKYSNPDHLAIMDADEDFNLIYLFVSRHEVHSMNTHNLQNVCR